MSPRNETESRAKVKVCHVSVNVVGSTLTCYTRQMRGWGHQLIVSTLPTFNSVKFCSTEQTSRKSRGCSIRGIKIRKPFWGVNSPSISVFKFFFIHKILEHPKKSEKIRKNSKKFKKIQKKPKNSKKFKKIRKNPKNLKNIKNPKTSEKSNKSKCFLSI